MDFVRQCWRNREKGMLSDRYAAGRTVDFANFHSNLLENGRAKRAVENVRV
jgi:hypothetical protein